MDIQSIMYFEREPVVANDVVSEPYYVAVTESGQVFYCETDEQEQPTGKWKLVSIDPVLIQNLH